MSDDRAVSTTINYVLGLGIAFALITGLLLAGGNFVQDQREQSMETELEVIGEQVAADIAMADRLAQTTTDNDTVEVSRTLPERVGGSSYAIAVEGEDDPYLVLETRSPEVTVEVEFENATAVDNSRITGGPIVVNKTESDELRVEAGGS